MISLIIIYGVIGFIGGCYLCFWCIKETGDPAVGVLLWLFSILAWPILYPTIWYCRTH